MESTGRRTKSSFEFPIDLVEEILSRLPAKHVLRCKLLSKLCCSLIQNPSFVNKHLFHHRHYRTTNIINVVRNPSSHEYNTIACFLSSMDGQEETTRLYTPPFHTKKTVIVGSCNGLLCLNVDADNLFTVWNPTIGEYLNLPSPNLHDSSDHKVTLGFGYSAKSSDYKLVKIGYDSVEDNQPSSCLFQAEVWSMRTNSWRDIGLVLPNLLSSSKNRFVPYAGLFIRGCVYWLVHSKDDAVLVSFDMSDETFRMISMPNDAHLPTDNLFLNEFMGSIALIVGFPLGSGLDRRTFFDLWVMDGEHYNNKSSISWNKKLSNVPFPRNGCPCPTRVSRHGNILMQHRYFGGLQFIFYDPHHNKEGQLLMEFPPVVYSSLPWSFSESIVSVKQHSKHHQSI